MKFLFVLSLIINLAYGLVGINDLSQDAPRLEIRTLARNPEQWYLFIQGLIRMKAASPDSATSYFQVAGIHGQPAQAWDGITAKADRNQGYCYHGNQAFYIWHRPYLALFEQALLGHVRDHIQLLPTNVRARYTNAAATLRLPYWDWTLGVAPQLTSTDVFLTNYNGAQIRLSNPLLSYTVPSIKRTFGLTTTSRNSNWVNTLNGMAGSLGSSVNTLLRNGRCWNSFVTSQRTSTAACPSNFQSLETIHDGVHVNIGGSMGRVPVAAFDPIFWLHHCNIDRIGSQWQTTNPNTWMSGSYPITMSNFMSRVGDTLNENSPVWPFRKSSPRTADWTYKDARYTTALGYTYGGSTQRAGLVAAPAPLTDTFYARITVSNISPPFSISLSYKGTLVGQYSEFSKMGNGPFSGVIDIQDLNLTKAYCDELTTNENGATIRIEVFKRNGSDPDVSICRK